MRMFKTPDERPALRPGAASTLFNFPPPAEQVPRLGTGASADTPFRWLPAAVWAPEEEDSVNTFIRCRITGEDPWGTDGLPPHTPAPTNPDALTARNSKILRPLNEADIPSVNGLVLLTCVAEAPGPASLVGLPMRGTYDYGRTRHVPVGSILAACDWARVSATNARPRYWWRAWRVPPEGPPYFEWEGGTPASAGGRAWTEETETPQERLARLLDEEIPASFEKWLDSLEQPEHGVFAAAVRRGAVERWRQAASSARPRRTSKRRRHRRRR